MSRPLQKDEAATLWGVLHSQGIRWCDSEIQARRDMANMAAGDVRRQRQARYKVRLVSREIGPLIEVENPYVERS